MKREKLLPNIYRIRCPVLFQQINITCEYMQNCAYARCKLQQRQRKK